jgi:hypothetical protein
VPSVSPDYTPENTIPDQTNAIIEPIGIPIPVIVVARALSLSANHLLQIIFYALK